MRERSRRRAQRTVRRQKMRMGVGMRTNHQHRAETICAAMQTLRLYQHLYLHLDLLLHPLSSNGSEMTTFPAALPVRATLTTYFCGSTTAEVAVRYFVGIARGLALLVRVLVLSQILLSLTPMRDYAMHAANKLYLYSWCSLFSEFTWHGVHI